MMQIAEAVLQDSCSGFVIVDVNKEGLTAKKTVYIGRHDGKGGNGGGREILILILCIIHVFILFSPF